MSPSRIAIAVFCPAWYLASLTALSGLRNGLGADGGRLLAALGLFAALSVAGSLLLERAEARSAGSLSRLAATSRRASA